MQYRVEHEGSRARLVPGDVPIWAIVGSWQVFGRGETALQYGLTLEAVDVAVAWYKNPVNKPHVDVWLEHEEQDV